MKSQLELINVEKKYGDNLVVDNINLKVERGEIVSLLGSSGCGKTTTLRMICGLTRPTNGIIEIEGKNVIDTPPYKRDLAMVFQNYALFPHLNVFDNIVYGLRTRKIKDKRILNKESNKVMEIVQLEGLENRFPRELSGGQQQRVSLARALIVDPKIMLFDEPLSNLDAKLREATRVEIRELLKDMGITAIYVTHDQEEALTISDRIAVMDEGKIQQITTPRELYNNPETKFIAQFIGQANILEGTAKPSSNGYQTFMTPAQKTLYISNKKHFVDANKDYQLFIRPENIEISLTPLEGNNCFSGRANEIIFLGSITRYLIDIGEKKEIMIDVNSGNEIRINKNDIVHIKLKDNSLLPVKR